MEELARYVTKLTDESKENASRIREAVVEYPSVFCQNYVELLDTPGMNDEDGMNETTLSGLANVDLAIVTVSANYPFSETECGFMVKLLENPSISEIIVVVTHIDMIPEKDRERLLSYMEQRIKEDVLKRLRMFYQERDLVFRKYERIFGNLNQFGVSSVDALGAYVTGDFELLERSGFPALNKKLPSFILSSQNKNTLQKAMETVGRILREYMDGYPHMVSEFRETVNRMGEMKHQFAREGYSLAEELANEARVRMFGLLNQFGDRIKQGIKADFRNCFRNIGFWK